MFNLFRLFSSCRHRNLSQPFSAIGRRSPQSGGDWERVDHISAARSSHYVVCLDCGQRYDYDWQTMRVIRNKRGKIA